VGTGHGGEGVGAPAAELPAAAWLVCEPTPWRISAIAGPRSRLRPWRAALEIRPWRTALPPLLLSPSSPARIAADLRCGGYGAAAPAALALAASSLLPTGRRGARRISSVRPRVVEAEARKGVDTVAAAVGRTQSGTAKDRKGQTRRPTTKAGRVGWMARSCARRAEMARRAEEHGRSRRIGVAAEVRWGGGGGGARLPAVGGARAHR
jgi:hypothetical protein